MTESDRTNIAEQLTKLAALRADGLLSDEEFTKLKEKLLNGKAGSAPAEAALGQGPGHFVQAAHAERKKQHTILIASTSIIAFVVLVGVASEVFNSATTTYGPVQSFGPSSNPEGIAANNVPDVPTADSTRVTAIDLAAAFNANEVAAQKTYGDRVLDVTGVISGVTLDLFSDPVIELASINEFLPVQASFDKSYVDKLSTLSKGQQITVRCSSLTEVISAPMLSHCTFPTDEVAIQKPAAPLNTSTGFEVSPPANLDRHTAVTPTQSFPDAPRALELTPGQTLSEEFASSRVVSATSPPAPEKLQVPEPVVTFQTSFDCGMVNDHAERLVCSDSELAALDIRESGLFREAMSLTTDLHGLENEEQDWHVKVRDRCVVSACLSTTYTQRIGRLKQFVPLADASLEVRNDRTSVLVVERFYHALERADGSGASSQIVPEKRSQQGLSAVDLTQFYSNMRSPLRLINAQRFTEDTVRVHYSYVQKGGRGCVGSATVKVVERGDAWLIESITPHNGC